MGLDRCRGLQADRLTDLTHRRGSPVVLVLDDAVEDFFCRVVSVSDMGTSVGPDSRPWRAACGQGGDFLWSMVDKRTGVRVE